MPRGACFPLENRPLGISRQGARSLPLMLFQHQSWGGRLGGPSARIGHAVSARPGPGARGPVQDGLRPPTRKPAEGLKWGVQSAEQGASRRWWARNALYGRRHGPSQAPLGRAGLSRKCLIWKGLRRWAVTLAEKSGQGIDPRPPATNISPPNNARATATRRPGSDGNDAQGSQEAKQERWAAGREAGGRDSDRSDACSLTTRVALETVRASWVGATARPNSNNRQKQNSMKGLILAQNER